MARTAKGAASRLASITSSESSVDFLGRPPSHFSESESGTTDSRSPSRSSSEPPNRSNSTQNRSRRPRKQAQPQRKRQPQRQPQRKRQRPGQAALKEIKRLQNTTDLLIPRRPFQLLVREILQKYMPDGRLQRITLEALQESAEIFVTNLFEDGQILANHRKRVTLQLWDMRLPTTIDPSRAKFQWWH